MTESADTDQIARSESEITSYKRGVQIQNFLGPIVQSVVSLTSLLRVISLTVLVVSIYNILIFLLHCKSYSHFFSKKFQHICISLNVNFNDSLTNIIVSFEQLGPDHIRPNNCTYSYKRTVKQFLRPDYSLPTLIPFFIKSYVVGTHLNCLEKSRQFKCIPTTYDFIKEVKSILHKHH